MTPDIYKEYPEKLAAKVFSEKPGLSGPGSIIFRSEEAILDAVDNPKEFHIKVISPYKLECDLWYTNKVGIMKYFALISITILVVVAPNSARFFRKLMNFPNPPIKLSRLEGLN